MVPIDSSFTNDILSDFYVNPQIAKLYDNNKVEESLPETIENES